MDGRKQIDNGTNHPHCKLPAVPPSYDETISYNKHVSMFLQLPKQLQHKDSKKILLIPEESDNNLSTIFWKQLRWCNQCSAKQATKMLCVLFSSKTDRSNLLD